MMRLHPQPVSKRDVSAAPVKLRFLLVLTGAIALIGASTLQAGSTVASEYRDAASASDFSRFEGRRIDSITIQALAVFDSSHERYRKRIFRFANRLHATTRVSVIRHELLFKPGDLFSAERAREMLRNLRERLVLREVRLEGDTTPSGGVLLRLMTEDQWSLTGGIRISRETDRTDYQVGFEEKNLLGLQSRLTVDFFLREIDNDYFAASYQDNRLGRHSVGLRLAYSDDELARLRSISLYRPFYDLSQQWSWSVAASGNRRRADVYEAGRLIAQWREKGERYSFSLVRRWGRGMRKLSTGFLYDFNEQAIIDRAIDTSALADASFRSDDFPADSLTHAVAVESRLEEFRYSERSGIDLYEVVEDKGVGPHLGVGIGRSYASGFDEVIFDRISLSVGAGLDQASTLVTLAYARQFYLSDGETIRRTTVADFRLYQTSLQPVVLALRSVFLADQRTSGLLPLNLGGKDGIRSFSRFARQGDRLHTINAELRLWTGWAPLSMPLALVGFVDIGAVWEGTEALSLSKYNGSPGAGIRLSLERIFGNEAIRIDVGRNETGKPGLTIELGQYF